MSYTKLFITIIVMNLATILNVNAQPYTDIVDLYAPYAKLLDKYVIEKQSDSYGFVTAFDYQLALSEANTLDLVKKQKERLADFDPESIQTEEQALAFWINAYNFFMISHILENPKNNGDIIDGVKDYGSFINPYRVFKQDNFNIGGRKYSLDAIEKDILLGKEYKDKDWKDARVHFAVNCASVGCPPLRKGLYEPDTIDSTLEENTRLALQTPRHLRFENDDLYLTQLFEWYEEDFTEKAGTIRDYLKKYTSEEMHSRIDAAAAIRFIDYDWALNRPANFSEISRSTKRETTDDRG